MLIHIDKNEYEIRETKEVIEQMEEFEEILNLFQDDAHAAATSLQDFIRSCPDHIDAIHHLALYHHECGNLLEAILLEKLAVEKVISARSKEIDLARVRLSWEALQNRPFLRALHALGIFQFEYGNSSGAQKSLQELLSFNRNDNLGARYVLTNLAFETDNPSIVLNLNSQFPDDIFPDLIFGKALAYIQLGQIDKAKPSLKKVVSLYPKIVDTLTRPLVEAEDLSSGYIVMGGEDQAFAYRQTYLKYWLATPEAMPLLKSYNT